MGNGNGNGYTAQQFIDAIPKSAGIISTIAARVGCSWATARKYINEYSTVKAAYDAEAQKPLDMAESVIYGNINAAYAKLKANEKAGIRGETVDSADAKWLLSRKGKDRGYVERQEVTGKDGGPVIVINWDSDESTDTD